MTALIATSPRNRSDPNFLQIYIWRKHQISKTCRRKIWKTRFLKPRSNSTRRAFARDQRRMRDGNTTRGFLEQNVGAASVRRRADGGRQLIWRRQQTSWSTGSRSRAHRRTPAERGEPDDRQIVRLRSSHHELAASSRAAAKRSRGRLCQLRLARFVAALPRDDDGEDDDDEIAASPSRLHRPRIWPCNST